MHEHFHMQNDSFKESFQSWFVVHVGLFLIPFLFSCCCSSFSSTQSENALVNSRLYCVAWISLLYLFRLYIVDRLPLSSLFALHGRARICACARVCVFYFGESLFFIWVCSCCCFCWCRCHRWCVAVCFTFNMDEWKLFFSTTIVKCGWDAEWTVFRSVSIFAQWFHTCVSIINKCDLTRSHTHTQPILSLYTMHTHLLNWMPLSTMFIISFYQAKPHTSKI